MWENNIFNPFKSSAAKNTTSVSKEDILCKTEMCDVCCRSYFYQDIRRIPYMNKSGTVFVIRCCPNCKIDTLTQYL